ncbi:PadR family transcriptional regulator [Microlunatus soli]|uniref:Virulence activator alpha C-term n=1 Tax=Microlunatus soli TaxID=630515 RepID=A0A1H2AIY3_9ACTN|nr:PadR family transcriptional regulator [Microlunatus soli]SDT45834.1 Virulence activator alpha C-term [Microlunatus soli]
MKFEHVILGLLSWRPFSGYELAKHLEVEGRFLKNKVHLSQIYRLLSRMVDSGWVSYQVSVNDGRPDSKIYRLTASGEQVLRDWVTGPYEPSTRFQDPEFMVRFTFGGPLDHDALLRLIRTELECRRAQVARFRTRDRTITDLDPIEGVDTAMVDRVRELSHLHGAASIDAWIDWLQRMLTELGGTVPSTG